MTAMASLVRLIYTSRATTPLSSDQLERLLAKSRANNRRMGLTGMLCAWNGMFAQCLEGEPESVDAVFSCIARDPRHRDLEVLCRAPIEERHFGDWSMQLMILDTPSPATELVRDKYPSLSLDQPIFRDPMVVFSLLFDLGFASRAP